jgi:hypothetical protein
LKIIKFFPSTFDLQAYPPSPWSKDTTIGMFLVRLLQKPFFFLPFKEELISHFDFKFSTLNKLDSCPKFILQICHITVKEKCKLKPKYNASKSNGKLEIGNNIKLFSTIIFSSKP